MRVANLKTWAWGLTPASYIGFESCLICFLIASLLTCLGREKKTSKILGPCHSCQSPNALPQPGSSLAIVAIWGEIQRMEDLSVFVSLFLPLPLSVLLCHSNQSINQSINQQKGGVQAFSLVVSGAHVPHSNACI